MTYMNSWSDRWRGSNDLGRAAGAFVSYLRPDKLCDWIKIFHVITGPSLTCLWRFCFGKASMVFSSVVTNFVSEVGVLSPQMGLSQSAPGSKVFSQSHVQLYPVRGAMDLNGYW